MNILVPLLRKPSDNNQTPNQPAKNNDRTKRAVYAAALRVYARSTDLTLYLFQL